MLSVLIVDDEKLARDRISFLLKDETEINICGESNNGLQAIKDIQHYKPDLVFLDVQMPEKNGFEVLQEIDPDEMPTIIFVTAYDKYALDAFEVCAIDYLLKPFDDERFFRALRKAQESTIKTANTQDLEKLIARTISGNNYYDRISIKKDGRIYFVETSEIVLIKASGKYVSLHTNSETHMLRKAISLVEQKLNPKKFMRIHRSTIININKIREMQHWHKGEYVLLMSNEEKVFSSSNYKENIQKLF
ncbi:MAG: DNA-binding response regulator [Calditrichaeota bacterium]|nr:MAG: DNA-binding response regulator [Calditrichota bacterium]MBL1207540.1 DNA-binding response regulator [Calditrichota bacterium]NOG47372.1 response regulator transcription factor [Calditrichota bacterium]